MAKRMKAKEFKEIFDKPYSFEAYGWEGILNMISIFEDDCANEYEARGCHASANASRKRAEKIYKILDKRGYYHN